jgi:hypothetical protein
MNSAPWICRNYWKLGSVKSDHPLKRAHCCTLHWHADKQYRYLSALGLIVTCFGTSGGAWGEELGWSVFLISGNAFSIRFIFPACVSLFNKNGQACWTKGRKCSCPCREPPSPWLIVWIPEVACVIYKGWDRYITDKTERFQSMNAVWGNKCRLLLRETY